MGLILASRPAQSLTPPSFTCYVRVAGVQVPMLLRWSFAAGITPDEFVNRIINQFLAERGRPAPVPTQQEPPE